MKKKFILSILTIFFLINFIITNSPVQANDDLTATEPYIIVTNTLNNNQLLLNELIKQNIEINDSIYINETYYTPIKLTALQRESLLTREFIHKIEKDSIVTVEDTTSSLASGQTIPWGIQDSEANRLFSKSCNCKIAIIDSGVSNHSELLHSIKAKVTVKNGIITNGVANDDNSDSHGTHVAGIIAANNDTDGIVGVTPDAQLYIAKALDYEGNGYISDIAKAVQWAVSQNVDVINMSLGTPSYSSLLNAVLQDAYNKGVVVIAASGNDGLAVNYPASSPYTIAVGAMNQQRVMSIWTSKGPQLDILAPGVGIYSTISNNNFGYLDGTSMAAPHVSGISAKLLSLYSGPKDSNRVRWVKTRLLDYANSGRDSFNNPYLVVNLYRSYYKITKLVNPLVKITDSNDASLPLTNLDPYIDAYGRVSVQYSSGITEYQVK